MTKHGQIFMIDRCDCKPIADVEEKVVQQDAIEGGPIALAQPIRSGC